MLFEFLHFSKLLYFFTLLIFTSGLFIMLTSDNYVRKIIGLSVMQSSVLIFYLIIGKVGGGVVPIQRSSSIYEEQIIQVESLSSISNKSVVKYSSPVPQVLMLTAIVVGFATVSVGLALIYLISKQFNTILESEIKFNE
ncbi:MAG: cation:proton antiporter subunit C [Rickettsia endosymbiont of Bryobia graminum]|nr:cation:proton antiporter subunit C [Rickettsia endosymbiont of Bryobia graminum]